MRYRLLPATIMLSAGAVTCVFCIYKGYETLYSLKVLLAVLIFFLIVGSLTRTALIKIMEYGEKKAKEEAEASKTNSDETNEENEKSDEAEEKEEVADENNNQII